MSGHGSSLLIIKINSNSYFIHFQLITYLVLDFIYFSPVTNVAHHYSLFLYIIFIYYVNIFLWMVFDQEDKSRVEIFGLYARKNRESVFSPFLNMLNRPDTFTINQASSAFMYCNTYSNNYYCNTYYNITCVLSCLLSMPVLLLQVHTGKLIRYC